MRALLLVIAAGAAVCSSAFGQQPDRLTEACLALLAPSPDITATRTHRKVVLTQPPTKGQGSVTCYFRDDVSAIPELERLTAGSNYAGQSMLDEMNAKIWDHFKKSQ